MEHIVMREAAALCLDSSDVGHFDFNRQRFKIKSCPVIIASSNNNFESYFTIKAELIHKLLKEERGIQNFCLKLHSMITSNDLSIEAQEQLLKDGLEEFAEGAEFPDMEKVITYTINKSSEKREIQEVAPLPNSHDAMNLEANRELKKWRKSGWLSLCFSPVFLLIFLLAFIFQDWEFNYVAHFLDWAESQPDFRKEIIKYFMIGLFGLTQFLLGSIFYKRIIDKDEIRAKYNRILNSLKLG